MMHVFLKDDDGSPTETATVAVVTHGTSRWEEKTGNAHDDTSTQGATAEMIVNGNNYLKEETWHNVSDHTKNGNVGKVRF